MLETTALFRPGDFLSHSGLPLKWKVECDALSTEDWRGLAQIAAEILPPFGPVEGVPSGGLSFAAALAEFSTEGPLLIVDDVCTTGASLEDARLGRPAIGVVAFARGPCPSWVTPLWQLSGTNAMSDKTTVQHIQSPVTGKFLCGWLGSHSGMYAGLDNAYRDVVIGNPSSPCAECVKTAAIALGVRL